MRLGHHLGFAIACVGALISFPAHAEDLYLSCKGRTEYPDGRFMFPLDDKYHVTDYGFKFWNKFNNIFVDSCGLQGDQCKTEVTATFIRYTRIYTRPQLRTSIHINRLTGAYLAYGLSLKREDASDPQISRTIGTCEKIANPAAQTPKF